MLRLVRYLKPYIFHILLAIVLLFVMAMSSLALPDYMANIVNVGIQQGGVQNAVPVAIRQSQMDKLFLFMSASDKSLVLGNYTLVDKNSPDYATDVKTYPDLAKEPVYVLKSVDQTQINQLDPIMGKALLIVASIQQIQADPAKAAALGGSFGATLAQLPPGTDLFAMLGKLPPAQLDQFFAVIDKKFSAMDPSMIDQAAVTPIKAEYTALGMDTGKIQSNYILNTGVIMLLLSLLSGACTITVGFLAAKTAAGFARDLRRKVFAQVENFSNTEFDKFSTASLITRSTNDITQVQMVTFMMIRMVFMAPIMGVGGIILAIGRSASMWWIIALAVVTLLCLILLVFSISLPKFKIMQGLIDRINLVTRENLTGMMVIRSFNKQEFEQNRFDKANLDLTKTSLFINRVMVTMMPVMMLIMNGLSLLIIWVGAHQIAQSSMQVGDMMAFLQYTMQIVFSFLMLSMMFIMIPRASVSGDRIADVLDTQPAIKDPSTPKQFSQPFKGMVEFRNVTFRYPGALEDALHNITFTAQPGQTTAIIGSTGAGKTTIVNLIPRLYEVTEGAIYVDGTDIREVCQQDLRALIGYVPQKSMLFSGTIASNLLYANESASDADLKEASDIAQASEFIFSKPEGLDGDISQAGANVSGGQKQRLSIARALVKKAPIYIFDDSFSALDFKTDSALRKALRAKTRLSTFLIVTQRVSTIKNADQIIVLDEGRVVGKGQHGELMQNCQTYREIALSQLSEEELA
ncbi:MAG: ABC transporter ATP-binding protein/permease [Chloroflexi bacterium]|nr:ABC transporter ATP-binding protein/permease [Chloroflexota bacterium]